MFTFSPTPFIMIFLAKNNLMTNENEVSFYKSITHQTLSNLTLSPSRGFPISQLLQRNAHSWMNCYRPLWYIRFRNRWQDLVNTSPSEINKLCLSQFIVGDIIIMESKHLLPEGYLMFWRQGWLTVCFMHSGFHHCPTEGLCAYTLTHSLFSTVDFRIPGIRVPIKTFLHLIKATLKKFHLTNIEQKFSSKFVYNYNMWTKV